LSSILSFCAIQTYIPNLYWQAKEKQRSILHDPTSTSINWSNVEAVFSSSDLSVHYLPCLHPSHPLALTTDLWTGPDHESYICLTGHFFDKDWILRRVLLDILLCTDRHSGENLSDWIKQMLAENEIEVWPELHFDRIVNSLISIISSFFDRE
jgi:hypothetical protein